MHNPPTKALLITFFLTLACLVAPLALARQRVEVANLPDAFIDPGPADNQFFVVVEKSTQSVHLYQYTGGKWFFLGQKLATTGEKPGDKMHEGDQKTPEGFYLFVDKHLKRDLAPIYGVLAFPMDYPNFWDIYQGKDGKGIWMHGTNRKIVPRDSNGCVALSNTDIMEFENLITLYQTPIVIYKEIKYKPLAELKREADNIRVYIDSWAQAWRSKKLDAYLVHYDENFFSDKGFDLTAWADYKNRLNHKYDRIEVGIDNLRVFRHRDVIVAIFEQDYRGDDFSSLGLKRLYIKERGPGYRIVAEVCTPLPTPPGIEWLPEDVKQETLLAAQIEKQEEEARTREQAAQARAPAAPVEAGEEKDIRLAVETWLKDWRNQDIEAYLDHYHPAFNTGGRDLAAYKAYKSLLFKKYKDIFIGIRDIEVKTGEQEAEVTFIQDYRSDSYQDLGIKTLVLVKQENAWKILSENWHEISAGAKP